LLQYDQMNALRKYRTYFTWIADVLNSIRERNHRGDHCFEAGA